ncbi:unnamed protein product [Aphanomyces euteiches]
MGKKEYKVKYGQYKSCERAYLGEDMPIPEFPKDLLYQRNERILGQDCELWTHNIPQSDLRIHVYESKAFNGTSTLPRPILHDQLSSTNSVDPRKS